MTFRQAARIIALPSWDGLGSPVRQRMTDLERAAILEELDQVGVEKMPEIPTGTVTFLFTDIEGSTVRWENDVPSMSRCLELHNRILRTAIERRGGYVFKTVGDAFCAAFSDAGEAVEAAIESQRDLAVAPWEGLQILVRMGLHAGVAEEHDNDYFGPTVNRVARLCSAGHGGQILLSEAARALVRDRALSGAVLVDLGVHHLKDLGAPERIYQINAQGLRAEFLHLASLDLRLTNLPEELTSYIGREKESADVMSLLTNARLVTLTGVGGSGKTRLGLRIAAMLLDRFKDGVWLVELAPVSSASEVTKTLCRVLGIREQGESTLMDLLNRYLSKRNILIVLDNCEHLLDDCAQLVEKTLKTCRGARFIATSRECLGVAGEVVYLVPPLAAPPVSGSGTAAEISQFDAVRLFLDRARAARLDFSIDEGNAAAIAEICGRLDGIPFAIELAAAKLRSLGPKDIARKLTDPLRLLQSGSRIALPRQRTLRALIDWSWALLDPNEQRALAAFSVFRGFFDLGDAEAVQGKAASDLIERLVGKSLVVLDDQREQTVYFLLEIVREYAAERLRESGTEATFLDSLIEHYRATFCEFSDRIYSPNIEETLHEFDRRRPTLLAVLDACAQRGDKRGLELAGEAGAVLYYKGDYSTALARCEEALSSTGCPPDSPAACLALQVLATARVDCRADFDGAISLADRALAAAGSNRRLRGSALRLLGDLAGIVNRPIGRGSMKAHELSLADSDRFYMEALTLTHETSDHSEEFKVVDGLAQNRIFCGDYKRAVVMLEEALVRAREMGDFADESTIVARLSVALMLLGRFEEARLRSIEGLGIAEGLGNIKSLLHLRFVIASIARAQGLLEEAERGYRLILESGASIGDYRNFRVGLMNLIPVLAERDSADECISLLMERIREKRCFGSMPEAYITLGNIAFALSCNAEPARATLCLGAGTLEKTESSSYDPGDTAANLRLTAKLRSALGDARYEELFAKGRAIGLIEALRQLEDVYPGCAALADSIAE